MGDTEIFQEKLDDKLRGGIGFVSIKVRLHVALLGILKFTVYISSQPNPLQIDYVRSLGIPRKL